MGGWFRTWTPAETKQKLYNNTTGRGGWCRGRSFQSREKIPASKLIGYWTHLIYFNPLQE